MNLLNQNLLEGKAILTNSEQERRAFFLACEEFGLSGADCKRAIYLGPSDENDLCFVVDRGTLKWGRLLSVQSMSKYQDKIIKWYNVAAVMSGCPTFTY